MLPGNSKLVMAPDTAINAFATNSSDTVQINLALSELVSDSPSELAFLVAGLVGVAATIYGWADTRRAERVSAPPITQLA